MTGSRVAVIDLGSNSARLVVFGFGPLGHLEVLEDAGLPLQLGRDLGERRVFSPAAFERTVATLRDFLAIAGAARADEVIAVATAAVREASNGMDLIEQVRASLGLAVEIIDGEAEARYGFLGAVHSLPVDRGFVLDIGGGSLELTQFRERRPLATWSLPLGALRLADAMLTGDPPSPKDVRRLRRHVQKLLLDAGVPPAEPGDQLIGTGGTIRNLAKIDRRTRSYPIPRLHGYVLAIDRVQAVADVLLAQDLARRATTPGLNAERADSIPAGAVTTAVVMQALGIRSLIVSGQGLREGVAYSRNDSTLPPPEAVRAASIAALVSRFTRWDAVRAERREAILGNLVEATGAFADEPEPRELLGYAARVLDIGTSIDYYNRLMHTATIVTVADLGGFSHRAVALLAAMIRDADRHAADLSEFVPVLDDGDRDVIGRAGTLLAFADEIERRLPVAGPATAVRLSDASTLVVAIPQPSSAHVTKLVARFERLFGRRVVFQPEGVACSESAARDTLSGAPLHRRGH